MKKMFSLLLAICMTLVVCIPSASAQSAQLSDLCTGMESISVGGVTTEENASATPRIIVYEGASSVLNRIDVYPAKHADGDNYYVDYTIRLSALFFNNSQATGTLRASPAKTTEVLQKFTDSTGLVADSWIVCPEYTIFTDNKGSYAEYFEFVPEGTVLSPPLTNGKIKVNLNRISSQTDVPLQFAFKMPADTSAKYYVGAGSGSGFYYYNSTARKHLSQGCNFIAYFNWTN